MFRHASDETVDGVLGNLFSDLDECIRKHLWPNLPQPDSGLPNVTVVQWHKYISYERLFLVQSNANPMSLA